MVQAVLDSVGGATQAQLRRGPRVTFSDDGEIGDDQGGVTREMFADFARRSAAPEPGMLRLLKVTPANRVQPEPCVPLGAEYGHEHQHGADAANAAAEAGAAEAEVGAVEAAAAAATVSSESGVEFGRQYRNLGRVCGMALWTGELLDVSFAPFFLKRVIDPDRVYSLEDNGADLAEEDPVFWQSLSAMLTAAEATTAPDEEVGVMFERTISSSLLDEPAAASAAGTEAESASASASVAAAVAEPQTVELIEGGSDIPVTHANTRDFVEKYLHHKMSVSIMPQARAFRCGLLDVLGDESLLTIFSASELSQLLGA